MKGKITSAYELEVIQRAFTSTLSWLEFYIENSGYSGNWQRQTEPIKRQDLNNQPAEIKGFMETALLALYGVIKNREKFITENLQNQFYSWLDKSGISVDNCPKGLSDCLTNIHKVLTNDGKDFAERVDREANEDIARMTPEERRKNFYNTFTAVQKSMPNAESRQKKLEGKTYKDIEIKNRFLGDVNQGKEIFNQIKDKKLTSDLINGDAVINNANQKQQELVPNKSSKETLIKIGIGGLFIALIIFFGIRILK